MSPETKDLMKLLGTGLAIGALACVGAMTWAVWSGDPPRRPETESNIPSAPPVSIAFETTDASADAPSRRLSPTSPRQTPHEGCFVRPAGASSEGAWCTWTETTSPSSYTCETTLVGCEAARATLLEIEREFPSDPGQPSRVPELCTRRTGAFCTDLGDGWANRQCRARREQCEALRPQHSDATRCVHRPTF